MIVGFIAILVMGITLGLLGAGGSILTIPILVYLFQIDPVLSTSYSLLLVGFIALFGAFFYFKKNQIDFKIAITFAIPAIISVYLTRRFLLPAIPDHFSIFSLPLAKDIFILSLFAVIMFMTSVFMIKGPKKIVEQAKKSELGLMHKYLFILIESSVVGIITAIIGAGGGFLIIPALILLNKMDVKVAIGTSLVIIAAKSLIGFIGDMQANVVIDYHFAFSLMVLSSIGMYFGIVLNKYLDAKYLQKAFGFFVMLTSIVMLVVEYLHYSNI